MIRGGFDKDMFELQRYFLMGFMMPYLAELHMPLGGFANKVYQQNDVPSDLNIVDRLTTREINRAIARRVEKIWLADQDGYLRLPKKVGDRTPPISD